MKRKLFIGVATLLVGALVVPSSGLSNNSSWDIDFIGSWPFGHGAKAVSVYGQHCYIGSKQGIYVLDISAPSSPEKIGQLSTPGVVEGFYLMDQWLYVADGAAGLRIVDVSNPLFPEEVGFWDTPGSATGVSVCDSYAYVADGGDLRVIDISNPSSPHEVACYDTVGSMIDLFTFGNYLYVVAGASGLIVMDISDPAEPQRVGSYNTPGSAQDVFVSDSYAYVADGGSGLRIIDITRPDSLFEVGFLNPIQETTAHVVVLDSNAFVVEGLGAWLRVIDVSNPSSPREIVSRGWAGSKGDLFVSGNNLYFTSWPSGLLIFDLDQLPSLDYVGRFKTTGDAWIPFISGNYAYVADYYAGVAIIDISRPSFPQEVGFHVGHAHCVYVSGERAYVAAGPSGLRVVNVSNSSTPEEEGSCETYGWARGVFVVDTLAYVAGAGNGTGALQIISVSNPASPNLIGTLELSDEEGWAVFIVDTLAYLGTSKRLQIVNVSNPSTPELVGSFPMTSGVHNAQGVYVLDEYAYAVSWDGLETIDISNPTFPQQVGFFPVSIHWPEAVFVVDTLAYLTIGSGGLRVIDVSDPESLNEVGYYDTPGGANGVFVSDGYAYVADGSYLLQVLLFHGSNPPNNPPSADSLISPEDGDTVSLTPTFRLIGTDPEGDNLFYKIELSRDDFANIFKVFDQTRSAEGWSKPTYCSGEEAWFTVPAEQALGEETYQWRAYACDSLVWGTTSEVWTFICSVSTEANVNDQIEIPTEFTLSQNHPNPFNPVTRIKYSLPVECHVNLSIYNVLEQKVVSVVKDKQRAGHKSIHWDSRSQTGNDVSSGVYFYRLQAGDFVETRKMILLR